MSEGTMPGEAAPTARHWLFGPAEFDEGSLELSVNGRVVAIDRRPLEALRHLLRNADRLVSKDDLVSAVWPGRVISDSALTSCMARLREALMDQDQQIVRTVHGYGYRLVAPVTVKTAAALLPTALPVAATASVSPPGPAPEDAPRAAARPLGRRGLLVAAAVAATALAALLAWSWRPTAPRPAPSIAVLPFTNMSAEPAASAHIVDGLHDTLITQLTRIQNLKVISRTSVRRYRDDSPDVPAIGRELGVAYVLEGSVQRAGNRIRLNAQLIDTRNDHHLWAEIYDRDVADLFVLQSELAQRVVAAVGARLTETERAALQQRPAASTSAYELYLKAREQERIDAGSREHLFRAQALLERAVAEDPDFALAHAALSRVHTLMYWFAYDGAVERRDRARAAAERALALDASLAEGHMSMGLYRAGGFRDYIGALDAYQTALTLQPGSAEIHQRIAGAWRRQGRWDEAAASFRRAIELDPVNGTLLGDAATLYTGLRRYADAAPLHERIIMLQPDERRARIARASFLFISRGDLQPMRELLAANEGAPDPDHALTYARYLLAMWEERYGDAVRELSAYPGDWLPGTGGGRVPKAASMGFALQLAGDADGARRSYERGDELLAAELRSHPDSPHAQLARALIRSGLDDKEGALAAAQRALDLMPSTIDPVSHAEIAAGVTIIHVQLGMHDRALDDLARLLRAPFGPSIHEVRVLPHWKPLRSHPRFPALVAG